MHSSPLIQRPGEGLWDICTLEKSSVVILVAGFSSSLRYGHSTLLKPGVGDRDGSSWKNKPSSQKSLPCVSLERTPKSWPHIKLRLQRKTTNSKLVQKTRNSKWSTRVGQCQQVKLLYKTIAMPKLFSEGLGLWD